MAQNVAINPEVLAQAVKTAEESVWRKFPNLQEWISGDKQPTVAQLADLAKRVNIPFGYFFLNELPKMEGPIPLFRTGDNSPVYNYSAELRDTILVIESRQAWLRDFLITEGMQPLVFVGSAKPSDGVKSITKKIRDYLELPVNWSSNVDSRSSALAYLIEKIEYVGVYVVINGIVKNSTRRKLNRDEFQGFALSDSYAPFIFLNHTDYPAAKIFTIMHELVHIWLGVSSVSDVNRFQPPTQDIEQLCNAVAAELLVDSNALIMAWERARRTSNAVSILAAHFKVSSVVISRRLLDIGIISKKEFFEFYEAERAKWERNENKSSGGDFYNNQPNRVGRAFFKVVDYAARSGKLLYSDAYKLTDLYGKTYHEFSSRP